MINFNEPGIESLEITFENDERKIKTNDTSLVLIEIWQGGNDNPEKTVTLTHEDKKYMHVNLKQITKTYDSEGKETVVKKITGVDICPEKLFITPYHKKFY